MNDSTFSTLISKLDGHEGFVSGHQIIKTSGATQRAIRIAKIPVWAFDDVKLRELIRMRFPLAESDEKQKRLAIRTIQIINLYYRVGLTAAAVAEELGMTRSAVIHRIRKIERQMGAPLKPSYRPKKGSYIRTDSEDRTSL